MEVKRNSGLFIGDVDIAPASGTIEITENGEYNVARYAMAEVDVAVGITVNESYDISEGTLTKGNVTLEGDVTAHIPDGVVTIGNKSFMGNETINKVIMPDSVTAIEDGEYRFPSWSGNAMAFGECINLKEVVFSNNLTSIGDYAFRSCSGLTSITIPDSVTSIGVDAFSGCSGLTDIYYTGTQAEWESITGLPGAGIPSGATIHYEYAGDGSEL